MLQPSWGFHSTPSQAGAQQALQRLQGRGSWHCTSAWNHTLYMQIRGGKQKAPYPWSSFTPGTSGWGTGHGECGSAATGPGEYWFSPVFSQLSAPDSCSCFDSDHAFQWKRALGERQRSKSLLFCLGLFSLPKPWWLFYKCPCDTSVCLRRLRNFCLSEMMSSVYPQPLYSESNCNQIPSCYPAFSTALTWQCHPL